jgi:hypothetical protein
MAREQFIESLRMASELLEPLRVFDGRSNVRTHEWDIWLKPDSVAGFYADDFTDLPPQERAKLAKAVQSFLSVADEVQANRSSSKTDARKAKKHLVEAIEIVRALLLSEWLAAQEHMISQATEAAKSKGWYVERDEKEISESLLGTYHAPRLQIRNKDREIILSPSCYFGSGQQGVVDLVVLPRFETAALITFRDGGWGIVWPFGSLRRKPFTPVSFVNTLAKLPLHR